MKAIACAVLLFVSLLLAGNPWPDADGVDQTITETSREMSGLVYHEDHGRLYAVEDAGEWTYFTYNDNSGDWERAVDWLPYSGTALDLEGITWKKGADSSFTPTMFVLEEENSDDSGKGIIHWRVWGGTDSQIALDSCSNASLLPDPPDQFAGFEAITFILDDAWPAGTCSAGGCIGGVWDGQACVVENDCKGSREGTGGLFVLGHQKNPITLYVVDIDHMGSTSCAAVKAIAVNPDPDRNYDIAGLDYDPENDVLWLMLGNDGGQRAVVALLDDAGTLLANNSSISPDGDDCGADDNWYYRDDSQHVVDPNQEGVALVPWDGSSCVDSVPTITAFVAVDQGENADGKLLVYEDFEYCGEEDSCP